MVRILLLEDNALDADLIRERLLLGGIPNRMDRVSRREAFTQALQASGYDLILADHRLPSFDGLTALQIAHELAPETPFIFVSGTLGEEIAIDALKRGATDYVVKHRLQRLPSAVERALAEARERAERRKAEAQQRLLIAELSHRVKNTLATVASLANQTLRRSDSLQAFETSFMGRLRALADTHTLLLRQNWSSVALREVIGQALQPFLDADDRQLELSGPEVQLTPKVTLPLGMILHELAANAVRHGALRSPAGRIVITWRTCKTGNDERLRLLWTERNGPPVRPPDHEGFGTMLIRSGASHELNGRATIFYPEGGLVCEFDLPLLTAGAAASTLC